MEKRIITSESVTCGHPDKLADLIADVILDECLTHDSESRVACEVMLAHDKVIIAGEITTGAEVDYIGIAKEVISRVGYDLEDIEFELRFDRQSPDICQAVNREIQGAGDQGIVFGYATDETANYMPFSIDLAHRLTDRLEQCRYEKTIIGLLPDGKAQVSVEYNGDKFGRIYSIIISAQHTENKDLKRLESEIKEKVIDYCLKNYDLSETEILINPSGRFIIGGLKADTGLTGRKLMVDTYGGAARHGGGSFSGKDASKLDRSGAYMARFIAKNIIAARLAAKCEVALTYAIGKAEPTSVDINTFNTAAINEENIKAAVLKVFDLTPQGIIDTLELKFPVYSQTAIGGHFGKDYLMWELTNKADELRNVLGF